MPKRRKTGRPIDKLALRRTGKSLRLVLPHKEHTEAQADAASRDMSLAAHVRDLLVSWRRR